MNKELKSLIKDARKAGLEVRSMKHGWLILDPEGVKPVTGLSGTPHGSHAGIYRQARRRLGL